jgi:hypothetical protein
MDIKEIYKENMTIEDFESIIEKVAQSNQDKVRTEYTTKIKELESKIPQEKSEHEIRLEQLEKELADKEKALSNVEKKANLSAKFSEKGLPTQLLNIVNLDGVEDVETFVNNIAETLNSHTLNNAYKPQNHKAKNEGVTKEQFKKMGYFEKLKLQETNENLFKKLSGN